MDTERLTFRVLPFLVALGIIVLGFVGALNAPSLVMLLIGTIVLALHVWFLSRLEEYFRKVTR